MAKVGYASRGFERERNDGRHDAGHREDSKWDARDDNAADVRDS
jgi:hypothetical protein